MPRIPIYTAEVKPKQQNLPMSISAQDTTGARVAQQGQELAEKWGAIINNLQAQRGDLEYLQKRADREAGIEGIKQDLARDPKIVDNPELYEQEFADRTDKLTSVIGQGLQTERGRFQYEVHTQRERPGELIKARGEGLKLVENKVQGQFVLERDRLSTQAGEAPNQQEYRANVELFDDLLKNMHERKLLSSAQMEEQRILFQNKTSEVNMKFIGDQSPTRMQEMLKDGVWKNVPADKKIAIVEHVETKQRVIEENKRKQDALITKMYVDRLEGLANFGNLPLDVIHRGQQGLDPLHPNSADWNRLAKLNEDAPGLDADSAVGMRAVDAIRLSHSLIGTPSKADSQKALQEIQALQEQGGLSKRATAHAIAASEHFQGHIKQLDAAELAASKYDETMRRAAKSENRADVNFEQSQNAKKVHDAMVHFDAEVSKSIVSGPIFTARRAKQRAQFEEYMRQNPNADPQKTLELIIGTTDQQRPPILDPSITKPR